eukprot:355907-Rhodomonas_salina.1
MQLFQNVLGLLQYHRAEGQNKKSISTPVQFAPARAFLNSNKCRNAQICSPSEKMVSSMGVSAVLQGGGSNQE